MDWDCLMVYSNGNVETANMLVRIFHEELGKQIVNVKNDLEENNLEAICAVVHRLKSNLKMFGYSKQLEDSETLEQHLRKNMPDPTPIIVKWVDDMVLIKRELDDYLIK